ncbi:peptidase inhibitor family I36 protein [Hamadaea sp. NPDC050747]|uniref:peptidase inhibitor family I36 protein n=1 Tax=Hamadaea sp. NPDC050747 TaxID=3155789 RepID=UPI0033C8FAF8
MRRSIVAAATAAVLASVMAAAPAKAGDTTVRPANCPSGYFCAYQLESYTGLMWKWSGDDYNWGNDYSGGLSAANRATSVYNNGTPCYHCDYVQVFDDTSFDVFLGWWPPGWGSMDLPSYQDNKIEAHVWGGPVG